MLARVTRALLLGVLVWGAGAAAQAPGVAWNAAPGNAADLSISLSGEVYAASARGDLWRWRDDISGWMPLAGRASRIAAGLGGQLWGVRADGTVTRFDGARWENFAVKATDVAVDPQGNAVIARDDGRIARWNPARKNWDVVPGRAHRLAVHGDGSIWCVAADGSLARQDGQEREALPGRARDIAFGAGAIVIADADGRLARWNAAAKTWDAEPRAPSDLSVIALSPGGVPWAATAKGAILTQAPIRMLLAASQLAPDGPADGVTYNRRGQRGGGSYGAGGRSRAAAAASAAALVVLKPPAQTTDPNPFEFVDTRGTAQRLAIGQDGSVFAIALDGALTRWSNLRASFQPFPGTFVRIAVDPIGVPWGIDPSGRVFRLNGAQWLQVFHPAGAAADISIAANGTVMTASSTGVLSRYVPQSDSFAQAAGELFSIALAPEGTPWGLLRDGTVMRCATAPCEQVGRDARSIAIGPDGSAFIVTFSNELRRFNAGTSQFEFIPVAGQVPNSVAVGPFGRPWVVTSTGRVYSSRFFERDESVDPQVAGGTSTTNIGTTSTTGFAFSTTLKFDTVPTANTPMNLGISAQGRVALLDGAGFIEIYNEQKRAFAVDASLTPPAPFFRLALEADGTLWGLDFTNTLYRRENNAYVARTAGLTSNAGFPSPIGIGIGGDGTVLATSPDNTLFRYDYGQRRFIRTDFQFAGFDNQLSVDPKGRPWVIDASNDLYEYTGQSFVNRGKAIDVWVGAGGTVFVCEQTTNQLKRWNFTSQAFTNVHNAFCTEVAVAPDGRPWIITPGGLVQRAR